MSAKDEIYALYNRFQPTIKKMARRYAQLDPAVGMEDLQQQAYLAIVDGVAKYDPKRGNLKIESYIYWHLQKHFNSLCPPNFKQVEIIYPNSTSKLISYPEFQKIKKSLPAGTTTTVTSTILSIESLAPDRDSSVFDTGIMPDENERQQDTVQIDAIEMKVYHEQMVRDFMLVEDSLIAQIDATQKSMKEMISIISKNIVMIEKSSVKLKDLFDTHDKVLKRRAAREHRATANA